jgi:hypothetical protein
VTVRLKNEHIVSERADGARGYPGRLSEDELHRKFFSCARRSVTAETAAQILEVLRTIDAVPDIGVLTRLCSIAN